MTRPIVVAAACAKSDWHGAHHWQAESGDDRYCPGTYA